MANAINWFEIPASNFERAVSFYASVIGENLHPFEHEHMQVAFFPTKDKAVGGSVTCGEGYVPSTSGPLVYLNGGDDLSIPLSRVESAGGKVIMPKTSIGENGFMAIFSDTEGNRVALHSMG